MDFSSGNSGNILRTAVIKTGPGCRQEGAFCQFLGPRIAPEVYGLIEDGYVMEALDKDPRLSRSESLQLIEKALEEHVWSRPALPISTDVTWREELKKVYGIVAPEDLIETPCLAHGDPTVSNILFRPKHPNVIMADPRPPRSFVPQCCESDMRRILQSYYGWEFAAYSWPKIDFYKPKFMWDPDRNRAAHFWCGAAAARIKHLELNRPLRPCGPFVIRLQLREP